MAQLLKRIVQAQVPNVLIEDLGYSGVFLRNVGDSRDLLGQFVDGKNKSKFTLEEVCNSRSLDNLIKRGHLKLFDEKGNELNNAAGSDAEKSTNIATLKDIDDAIGGDIVTNFISLTDTPDNYSGFANYGLRVNSGETGIEFYVTLDTDEKVSIDADAAPGYIGSAFDDGVLRVSSPLTYSDGGDFITIGFDESSISITSSQVTDFSEAVDDRVSVLIQNGTGITWTYVDASNTLTGNVSLSPFSTTDLSEGTNLYYTDARVDTRVQGQNYTITGSWTFNGTLYGQTPTAGAHLTTKDYVDSLVNGIDWQESVLNIQVDNTLDPGASPTVGDRYILTDTGNLNANFGTVTGVGNNDIVEYTGSVFEVVYDVSSNTEGGATWVEDENVQYVFNGTSWVTLAATSNHNSLSGLQGGTTSQYYHLTSAQHSEVTTFFASTDISAAEAETLTDGSNADSLHVHTASGITDFSEAVDDRVNALIQNGTGITWTYVDASNTLTGNVSLSSFSTTDLSEGTNLYYTDERVDDRVSALIQNGTGITWTYNDVANTLTGNVSLSSFSTTDLSEGINLYYTDERVDDRVANLLIEGNAISLTYTDISNTLEIAINESAIDHTNLQSIGIYTHSTIDAHIDSTANPHSTSDANLLISDISTNNTTTLAHGFAPKLSGVASQFLDGQGNWTTPAGTANAYFSQSFSNQTSVNVNHNFGAYPIVQVLVSDSVYIPFSITHNTINDFTVTFTSNTSGIVLATLGSPQLNNYIVVSSDYTATNNDFIVEVTSVNATVTLPTAVGIESKIFHIKNVSSGNAFVDTTSSQLMDFDSTITLRSFESISVYSNGSNYRIF